jgi:hypothetical protein
VAATAVQSFVLDGVAATPQPPVAVDDSIVGGSADSRLGTPSDPTGVGVAAGADQVTGTVAVSGDLSTTAVSDAEVSVGPVTVARGAAVGVLVALASVVVLGWLVAVVATRRARRRGEAALLATCHRGTLVSLGGPPSDEARALEVATFDSLRRVADTVGQPIGMSASSDGDAQFWVTDGARSWRYRSSGS